MVVALFGEKGAVVLVAAPKIKEVVTAVLVVSGVDLDVILKLGIADELLLFVSKMEVVDILLTSTGPGLDVIETEVG